MMLVIVTLFGLLFAALTCTTSWCNFMTPDELHEMGIVHDRAIDPHLITRSNTCQPLPIHTA
jgi:hypothetical protein